MMTMAVLAIVLAGCCHYAGLFDAERLADGIPSLVTLVTEMFPPDFSQLNNWIGPLTDTLAMSVAGTAIAVILSVPLGVLAARNTSPNPVVFHLCRGLLNGLRSIPELIMGIVFVAAVGFGALPGVLALAFHSVGMVAKFFAESIEHVDPGAGTGGEGGRMQPLAGHHPRHLPSGFPANGRYRHLSLGIQLPCFYRHGDGRGWRYWFRTDRLVADYAVSGSIGHSDRDFADGDDRRCFQFMAAQENTIIEGKK